MMQRSERLAFYRVYWNILLRILLKLAPFRRYWKIEFLTLFMIVLPLFPEPLINSLFCFLDSSNYVGLLTDGLLWYASHAFKTIRTCHWALNAHCFLRRSSKYAWFIVLHLLLYSLFQALPFHNCHDVCDSSELIEGVLLILCESRIGRCPLS